MHKWGISTCKKHSLINTIFYRDSYTYTHSLSVAKYTEMIGRNMGMSEVNLELLRKGALLHDIGKIVIDKRVLAKPDKLDEYEYIQIKKHPEAGARILGQGIQMQQIVPMVLYHHEHFDGKGYPFSLKGNEIPQNARIVAVADAFDAMISNRPYRKAFSIKHAIRELVNNSGSHFDPEIVTIFIKLIKKRMDNKFYHFYPCVE
ncbi:MAG: HD-GYP domain-containing protein [Desulfitobacteriaceae bacterium]